MKKTILAISVAILAILTIGGVYAYNFGNRYNANNVDKIGAENALESGDYSTWKALHQNVNGRMAQLVTNETQFELMQKMHESMESGDYSKAQEIKSQMGFKSGQGQGLGKGKGRGMGMHNNGGIGRNSNCPYAISD